MSTELSPPDELATHAQPITDQPDGPGRRIGTKGELTIITELTPGGGRIFRERAAQAQAQAGYWEPIVGTVENFRVLLFDNDTRMIITLIYDGDFLPYLADIANAHSWLDLIFKDVVDGYQSLDQPDLLPLVASRSYSSDVFFHATPDASVHDVHRMQKLSKAFNEALDAAG